MNEHVSINDLNQYLLGELTPSELSAFDRHIGMCDECRSMARDRSDLKESVIALEHALTAKWPDHLTYDELEGVVDYTLAGDSLSRVQGHLDVCLECRGEVDNLKEFTRPASEAQVDLAARPVGWLGRLNQVFSARRWAVVTAVGTLTVIGASFWFAGQREPAADPGRFVQTSPGDNTDTLVTAEQRPVNTEIAANVKPETFLTVSLKDGGTAVGLDTEGTIVGYDSLSAAQAELLRSALKNGNLTIGSELRELVPGSPNRMGEKPPADASGFRVVSPIGRIIDTGRPTFSWKPLEGAQSYRVDVFDINYRKVVSSGDLQITQWTTELPRGRTYVWQVAAIRDGAEIRSSAAPASEARFRTLDIAKSRDLASIKMQYPNSHLLLGLSYAEAGMITESRREIEILERQNQSSTLPKKLLLQLSRPRK